MPGRRVVVTGAASGIGRATAELFTREGEHVIAVDRVEPPMRVGEYLACDLSDPASIDRLVALLPDPIHVLCNVAGVPGTRPAETVMRVNFLGLRHLTETLLPRIADRGAVVNVASCAGDGWRGNLPQVLEFLATPDFAAGLEWCRRHMTDPVRAYDFSKEAVIVYTMAVAGSQWGRGVRVNSVSPGAVETPILPEFYASMDAGLLHALKAQAGGRDGRPEEIAPAIAFLAGAGARWINGTDVTVDGGAEAAVNLGRIPLPS